MVANSFNEIKNLVEKDDFLSSLDLLEAVNTETLSSEQKIIHQFLYGIVKYNLGQYEESLVFFNDALKKGENITDNHLFVDLFISKLFAIFELGDHKEFPQIIDEGEKVLSKHLKPNSNNFSIRKGKFFLLRGKFLEKKGEYDESLAKYEQAKDIFKKLNLSKYHILALGHIAQIIRKKGDRDTAEIILTEAHNLAKEIKSPKLMGYVLNGFGSIHLLRGEHKKALECYLDSLKHYEKIGNRTKTTHILINIGNVYYMIGELDQARDYYEKVLPFIEKGKNKQLFAFLNFNIAQILKQTGDFDKALEHMNLSLKIIQQLGDVLNIIAFLNDIGRIYHQKGDFEQAFKHLQKAYQLKSKITNNLQPSKTLYYLVALSIDRNDIKLAKKYLEELINITNFDDNRIIAQCSFVAEALILMTETRSKFRVKAEELLIKITNSEIIDNELFIDATINLIEIHLVELKQTNNPELLEEIKNLLSKLETTAINQHQKSVLAEVYWLHSQIALIDLDVKEAKRLLNQAEIITNEIGYERLAYRISKQHDQLLNKLDKWDILIEHNASLIERMDFANIEDFILQVFRQRKHDIPAMPIEEPILLIFLKPNGLPIYSKSFPSQKNKIDDSMISGFLTAINAFLQEAFEVKGFIERIKHKEFTLSFQKVEFFFLCYVYKGQSFNAIKRLRYFIDNLKANESLWGEIKSSLDISAPIDIETEEILEKIINKEFLVEIFV